jgi:predicted ATPase/DNA-binding SARP family transcriptional activator
MDDSTGLVRLHRMEWFLLGPPVFRVDAVPTTIDRRKTLALFAYLAIENREHSRAVLTDLLYPEQTRERAMSDFRQTLSYLRRLIGKEHLHTTRSQVVLRPSNLLRIDTSDFITLIDRNDRYASPDPSRQEARLRNAAALYRGPFLDGFYIRRSAPFDEWQGQQRESLERRYVAALEELSLISEKTGRLEEAVRWARLHLERDDLDETVHRRLIGLYASLGRRRAALEQYELCRRIVERELGCEPEEETCRLAERIGNGDGAPPAAFSSTSPDMPDPRATIPHPLTPLVGRTSEVDQVVTALVRDGFRVLTLTGTAGVGKTRLAIEIAIRLYPHTEDGVFFVDLSSTEDHKFVVREIMAVLEIRSLLTPGVPNPARILSDYVRGRDMLLVLDNFEQVLPAANIVSWLIRECPRLKILVTSREPLCVQGEQEVPVLPLPVSEENAERPANGLEHFPAVDLFVQRARSVRPDFCINATNDKAVASICTALDGLPLAIEMAALWIRLLSPAELLEHLVHSLNMEAPERSDLLPRHRSLHDALDWSFGLLTGPEKTLFKDFSVFTGGGTLEAVQHVFAPLLENTTSVIGLLESLVRKNLVTRSEAGEESRFTMLLTIQEYACGQLERNGQAHRVAARHADYYRNLAESSRTLLRGPNQALWLRRLDLERNNFHRVMRDAMNRGDPQGCLRLAVSLRDFWRMHGGFPWGPEMIEESYGAVDWNAQTGETALQTDSLLCLAEINFWTGDWARARELLRECLPLAQVLDDPGRKSSVIGLLGICRRWLGESAEGMTDCLEAIALARKTHDPCYLGHSLIMAYGTTGGMYIGDPPLEELEEALRLLGEAGDLWGCAHANESLGDLLLELDDPITAGRRYRVARTEFRDLGDKWMEAWAVEGLGRVAFASGQFVEAARLTAESLRLFYNTGDTTDSAVMLRRLGLIEIAAEHMPRAATLLGASGTNRTKARADDRLERRFFRPEEETLPDAFADEWKRGAAMTFDEAVKWIYKDAG